MKNKKNIMIGTIVIVLLALGLFIYQKFVKQQLHFKDDLTVEINGKFDPLSYISEVEHGNIKEVTCQSKNLNIKKLGEYEIVYTYKNRDYEAMIQVVDTTKPVFNGLNDLAVSINTTPDLKAGVEVSDNSLEEIIYVFLTIFLYLLKCPQSLILSALRAFCFCGKPHISRSIFLYFRYQAWLKSW